MNVKHMIGMPCRKTSKPKTSEPKPFKSGLKINTIKGVVINPNTGNPAFTFNEDDSYVDTHCCILLDEQGRHVEKNDINRQKQYNERQNSQICLLD